MNAKRWLVPAIFLVFAGPVAAETFTVCFQDSESKPLSQFGVTLALASDLSNVIGSGASDATGCVSIVDGAHVGVERCLTGIRRPGWSFVCSGGWSCIGCPTPHPVTYPDVCMTSDAGSAFVCTGDRANTSVVTVFGGAKGYVNPNAGESATIVVRPRASGRITIKISTLRGKPVATLEKDVFAGKQNNLTWDCRNSNNELVGSGIYVAHAYGANTNERVRIAVVRK